MVCKNTSVNGGYYKIIQIMIHVMYRLHRGLIYDFVTCSTSSWLCLPGASIAPQPVVCLLPPLVSQHVCQAGSRQRNNCLLSLLHGVVRQPWLLQPWDNLILKGGRTAKPPQHVFTKIETLD